VKPREREKKIKENLWSSAWYCKVSNKEVPHRER